MVIHNRDYALTLLSQGEQDFTFPIEPNIVSKFQLLLTGKAIKGIELFRIGPNEIRALGFMVEFYDLVNNAVENKYRVFVYKNGTYFGNGAWYLKFIRNS